eukprot:12411336-Alexandrium_andersonii.AAC.1
MSVRRDQPESAAALVARRRAQPTSPLPNRSVSDLVLRGRGGNVGKQTRARDACCRARAYGCAQRGG